MESKRSQVQVLDSQLFFSVTPYYQIDFFPWVEVGCGYSQYCMLKTSFSVCSNQKLGIEPEDEDSYTMW